MQRVTVQNGLAYIDGKLIGVLVSKEVADSVLMPTFGDGPVRVVVAKDQEGFEQLAFYEWRANIQARKSEVQRRYNKGDNASYEHVLKPMDDWMSSDDDKARF